MKQVFVGMDIGTTGVKSVVLSEDGRILLIYFEEYPLYSPYPGWSEQDPEDWWNAVLASLKFISGAIEVQDARIAAISMSGQMHSSVFLDDKGLPLRRAILWNDTRTFAQREEIERIVGRQKLLDMVYNLPLEGFTAPKILWFKENEPDIYRRLWKVLLPKDYISFRLTGRVVAELSDASGTALLDVVGLKWATDVIEELGLKPSFFPEIVRSFDVVGTIRKDIATDVGIPEDCVVVAGGADNVCGAVGSGVVSDGQALISLGSSGVVFVPTTDPGKRDKSGVIHFFNHAPSGTWYNMGVTLSAGLSLKWFRENFCRVEELASEVVRRDVYELLTEVAERIPIGSEGLLFLPYLNGERTPHMDSKVRGAFVGASLRHTKSHFIRSVIEGVSYSLKDVVGLLEGAGIRLADVRVTGGGTKSRLWLRIIASLLNVDVKRLSVDEGPAFGAAIIAAVGVGARAGLIEATREFVQVGDVVKPDESYKKEYEKWYPIYRELYPSLKGVMHKGFEVLSGG